VSRSRQLTWHPSLGQFEAKNYFPGHDADLDLL